MFPSQIPFLRYLSVQFSIAFDLYLAIRASTAARVKAALCRDTPDWRLKHTCPACLYTLKGEPDMEISMLTTYDGNDSLKRVQRRADSDDASGETLGRVIERIDTRRYPNDLILPREEVDRWAKETADSPLTSNADSDDNDNESPCSKRWHNMSERLTAIASGIYEETGWFLAVCRHSFPLVGADMVRSGELYVLYERSRACGP